VALCALNHAGDGRHPGGEAHEEDRGAAIEEPENRCVRPAEMMPGQAARVGAQSAICEPTARNRGRTRYVRTLLIHARLSFEQFDQRLPSNRTQKFFTFKASVAIGLAQAMWKSCASELRRAASKRLDSSQFS
jgi:hypothetical protein